MKYLKNLSESITEKDADALKQLRAEIDAIDQKLIKLFDDRAALVFKVGEWKKKNSFDVHDPKREQQILNKIIKTKRQFLKDSELQSLFSKMIEFYRNTEKSRSLIQQAIDSQKITKQSSFGFFGFGLMGASVALALYEQYPEGKFLIYDPNINTSDFELWNQEKANSTFQIVNLDQLKELDFVFLGAPIDINQEVGSKLSQKNRLTLNLGSYQDQMKNVVGFHPLAGKETTGYQAAQGDLFYNKVICVTHLEFTPKETLEVITALVHSMGAEIFATTNENHNKNLAYSSHLIQLLSMIFGLTLEKNSFQDFSALIPNTARDFLRLTGSDFKMWEPIFRKNQKFIQNALNDFEKNMKEIKALLPTAAENDSAEELPLKDSFRKINSHLTDLRELFIKGHQIYENLYKKRKAK